MSADERDSRRESRPDVDRRRVGPRGVRALGRGLRATVAYLTPLGWLAISLLTIGCLVGITVRWVEAWFLAAFAAMVLLCAMPFLAGARAYRTAIAIRGGRVVAGDALRASVEITNVSRRHQLPAVAELPVGDALRELPIPVLGAGNSVDLPIELATAHRGVVPVGPLTLARQDPLGILRRKVRWREWHLVHVHPRTVQLPAHGAGLVRDLEGQASRRLSDADLSFHAVREYVPGDAVRHVHWKATAKTGALMVRQYEESQTARVAVLFDARETEYADREEFELGVSIAASISVQAVREGRERFVASSGARRGWQHLAESTVSLRDAGVSVAGPPRRSVDGLDELPSTEADQLLDAWAELGPIDAGAPFEVLAHRLAESRRSLSIVAIVTGSAPDLARLRQAANAFPPEVHVLCVRAELLASPRTQMIGRLTLLTVGALEDVPGLLLRGVR